MVLGIKSIDQVVKIEEKVAKGGERSLRVMQGIALLAIALNHKQFSVFGRTIPFSSVKSFANTARFAIYAHMIGHNAYKAWHKDEKYLEGASINALITALFLHDCGIVDLGEHVDFLASGFKFLFFKTSVEGLLTTLKSREGKSKSELAQAFADSLFWMPVSLLGVGGPEPEGVFAILTGGLGLYNVFTKEQPPIKPRKDSTKKTLSEF